MRALRIVDTTKRFWRHQARSVVWDVDAGVLGYTSTLARLTQ
jgi:hypothetical protein